MKEVVAYHARCDDYLARVFKANSELAHCCRQGCFACCSEAVYVGEVEVLHILENLTSDQLEELKPKIEAWIKKTKPLLNQNMPDATAYRQLFAPCVFLKDGLCSVYDRRPYSCRVWFALKNPADCQLPARTHQKYADFMPGIAQFCGLLAVNNWMVADHLGVFLAKYVLKRKVYSASRKKYHVSQLRPEFKAVSP